MKLHGVIIATTLLFSVSPLLGQTRGAVPTRRGNPNSPAGNRGTPGTAPPVSSRGAGTVAPPEGGYVADRESASPGSVTPAVMTDPVERAYWDLFDRKKQVTLTGKVTRISWTNPNTYIFLIANGTEWAIESSFSHFRQSSVTPAIKVDQTITVSGYLLKDELPEFGPVRPPGSVASYRKEDHFIRANEITTESGQKLAMGKPLTEREDADRQKCLPLGC